MQPAVVAQREAGSCRMSGEQAVRAGQVAPVATQRGPPPLQSTTSQGGSIRACAAPPSDHLFDRTTHRDGVWASALNVMAIQRN